MSASVLSVLSDGDAAKSTEFAARRRSMITVAQAEQVAAVVDSDRLSLNLLNEFRAAWSTNNHDQMTAVMLAAIDLDQAAPGAPRLVDEIRGMNYQAAA
ncbi:hypothetical protein ACFYPN_16015 [Streptomyces sp. NPDC005576]|uniref:hypothetical protein n=1 Tax=Streptomyces sp. NPDC005576 TaxID=3364726 RepID=UPI0036945431